MAYNAYDICMESVVVLLKSAQQVLHQLHTQEMRGDSALLVAEFYRLQLDEDEVTTKQLKELIVDECVPEVSLQTTATTTEVSRPHLPMSYKSAVQQWSRQVMPFSKSPQYDEDIIIDTVAQDDDDLTETDDEQNFTPRHVYLRNFKPTITSTPFLSSTSSTSSSTSSSCGGYDTFEEERAFRRAAQADFAAVDLRETPSPPPPRQKATDEEEEAFCLAPVPKRSRMG